VALCQGSPMRTEIEALGPEALDAATDAVAAGIAARFGTGPFAPSMQALIIEATP